MSNSFCQQNKTLFLVDSKGNQKEISFNEISEIELLNNEKFLRIDSITGNIWIIKKYDFKSDSIIRICVSKDSIISIRKIRLINNTALFAAPSLYFLYLSFNDLLKSKYQNSLINFGGFAAGLIIGIGISAIWPYKKYKFASGQWKTSG